MSVMGGVGGGGVGKGKSSIEKNSTVTYICITQWKSAQISLRRGDEGKMRDDPGTWWRASG